MADSHSPPSKRSIIVVDDNPDLIEIVCVMLEAKGYNVMCANSGKELFAGLEKQMPRSIHCMVSTRSPTKPQFPDKQYPFSYLSLGKG